YFDNIYIKGFRSNYNKERISIKGIKKYILKYFININKILFNVKLIRGTIVIIELQ
ncbi:hypothetical protein QBC45DRAFT_329359, partial [Copromyces sp. CBS 386.78]